MGSSYLYQGNLFGPDFGQGQPAGTPALLYSFIIPNDSTTIQFIYTGDKDGNNETGWHIDWNNTNEWDFRSIKNRPTIPNSYISVVDSGTAPTGAVEAKYLSLVDGAGQDLGYYYTFPSGGSSGGGIEVVNFTSWSETLSAANLAKVVANPQNVCLHYVDGSNNDFYFYPSKKQSNGGVLLYTATYNSGNSTVVEGIQLNLTTGALSNHTYPNVNKKVYLHGVSFVDNSNSANVGNLFILLDYSTSLNTTTAMNYIKNSVANTPIQCQGLYNSNVIAYAVSSASGLMITDSNGNTNIISA